jgi:asparagine synthase (glutamine-hydrolysing)
VSGLFYVDNARDGNLEKTAVRCLAQMTYGGEPVHHYAVTDRSAFGLVSQDKFKLGVMPRYLPDTGLWGVMVGELHGCAFLDEWQSQHPDTEHPLEIFAELHRDNALVAQLPYMNGAFFALLYDPTTQALTAFNDRFGLYPVYWAHGNDTFCLASRVLCSVLAGAVDGDWDVPGVAQLLTIDDFLGETTLVKGVESFPQATVLTRQGDSTEWRRYWHYDYTPRVQDERIEDVAARLGDALVESVKRQSTGDRRVGVTLSGGLDSRCLVAAAHKLDLPTQSFTWGDAQAYDRMIAQDVAKVCGATHHDCAYEYENFESCYEDFGRVTEGLVNVFDGHMLTHLHNLKPHAELILNGFAGGLSLGGSYLRSAWMGPMSTHDLADRLFAWRNTLVAEDKLDRVMPDVGALTGEGRPSYRMHTLLEPLGDLATGDRVDRFFLENRERRLTAMGTVMLRSAVESAACFFDYDLIDLNTAVPADWRIEHRIYKAMLNRTFPEAAAVRWQRTLLPASAPEWMGTPAKAVLKGLRIMENKVGWPRVASRQSPVNFANALRGPLQPWMQGVVRSSMPETDAVLMQSACDGVWDAHLRGQDHTRMLGAIAAIRSFGIALAKARKGDTDTVPAVVVGEPE